MAFRRAHLHFRLALPLEKSRRSTLMRHANAFILWLAQGFGRRSHSESARHLRNSSWASPGLRSFCSPEIFGFISLAPLSRFGLSVWLCGAGEKIQRKEDPGSIVFDEIAAIPVCFIGWLLVGRAKTGSLPTPGFFFSENLFPALSVSSSPSVSSMSGNLGPSGKAKTCPAVGESPSMTPSQPFNVNVVVLVVLAWSGGL